MDGPGHVPPEGGLEEDLGHSGVLLDKMEEVTGARDV